MSLLVSIQAKIMVVELFKIFMELVVFVLMLLTDTAGESEWSEVHADSEAAGEFFVITTGFKIRLNLVDFHQVRAHKTEVEDFADG